MQFTLALVSLVAAASAAAKTVTITVANSTSATNASSVFTPQQIDRGVLQIGDTVVFNFTEGSNHSAIQADFASPCLPLSQTNGTVNSFNSGPRDTVNGTVFTQLTLAIDETNVNSTIWFYDADTCAIAGVGVISPNDTTLQTLVGFERNAIRLNGTGSHTSAAHSATGTNPSGTGGGAVPSQSSGNSSGAERTIVVGAFSVIPLLLAAFATL